jgi:hypothetical protein
MAWPTGIKAESLAGRMLNVRLIAPLRASTHQEKHAAELTHMS